MEKAEIPFLSVSQLSELIKSRQVSPVEVVEGYLERIDRLNDRGEILPELLTNEPAMQATIREHPALRWKALNAREHRNAMDDI